MEQRINISKIIPEGYRSLFPIEKFIAGSGLKENHLHLIKIRASQVNGCAYCINMHSKEARAAGESENRIYLLSQWRELEIYDAEEKAVLALTEEVTLIHNHLSEKTYRANLELFGEDYLAKLIIAIVAINAWNRIGISTLLTPEY